MSNKSRAEIKKLETLKNLAEIEVESLKLQQTQLKQEIKLKSDIINNLKQKIENLTKYNNNITVSEHAVLRYIERVIGINLEETVEKILPESIEETIKNLGNGQYPVNNGEFKIVVKDNVVVTILTEKD